MGARSSTSHALHTLGATSESSESPSAAETCVRGVCEGPNVAQIHRHSNGHGKTEKSQPGPSASSFGCAADTSKPERQWSPAKREDSIQKRERRAEVNTVLMIAGNLQWERDRILDGRPKSTSPCKTTGAAQHGQVRCGRSGQQAANTKSFLDTLGTKTAAGHGSHKM